MHIDDKLVESISETTDEFSREAHTWAWETVYLQFA